MSTSGRCTGVPTPPPVLSPLVQFSVSHCEWHLHWMYTSDIFIVFLHIPRTYLHCKPTVSSQWRLSLLSEAQRYTGRYKTPPSQEGREIVSWNRETRPQPPSPHVINVVDKSVGDTASQPIKRHDPTPEAINPTPQISGSKGRNSCNYIAMGNKLTTQHNDYIRPCSLGNWVVKEMFLTGSLPNTQGLVTDLYSYTYFKLDLYSKAHPSRHVHVKAQWQRHNSVIKASGPQPEKEFYCRLS